MCRSNNCYHGWDECENRCGNHWNNFSCDPFEEVERIARRTRNRRYRENRCARQFVRCMRTAECEDNHFFYEGCCNCHNCCNHHHCCNC